MGWAVASTAGQAPQPAIGDWLFRLNEASRSRNYAGTFVVLSHGGAMSSGRIWHLGSGNQQIERLDTLSGAPRTTLRRNSEVLTFLPESKLVRSEKQDAPGFFPELLKAGEAAIADFYAARRVGSDRVAGFDADVVELQPRDAMRFGHRIWSEKASGLMLKLQTLDASGRILEQVAFSELQFDQPMRSDQLAQMAQVPPGWRLEKLEPIKTAAEAQGWRLSSPVPGFRPINCYKRPQAGDGAMQWIFSDGLASVSLFIEAYTPSRHVHEGVYAAGATHTLTRRLQGWWVTVVGEVPPSTLRAFAQHLKRHP